MPQPTPSDNSLATNRNNDLGGSVEEFDLLMDQSNYIWSQIAPVIDVAKDAGTFGIIPIEQLLQQRTTERAPAAGYNRATGSFKTTTYTTQDRGLEEPVDDLLKKIYADYFDAEVIARNRCIAGVLRDAEQRWADIIFDTTYYTGSTLTTTVANAWTSTNSTPIDDVEAAVRKVWDLTGLWCNSIVLNKHEYRSLRQNDQILDRIAANGAGSGIKAAEVTRQMIAQCFDLDNVFVGGGAKNTASENKAAQIGKIWADDLAMVCVTATTDDISEPCIGRTFHYTEDGSEILGHAETYREEKIRSEVVRIRHHVGEKSILRQAGHLLQGI